MKSLKLFAPIFVMFMIAGVVQADVSLKNGNFYMSYTDIVFPGGFEPKLERVYNSRSGFKGMFGWGWSCEFDVYLKVSPDGAIVVHEYGGGAQNRFESEEFNQGELAKAVDIIARAAIENRDATSYEEVEKLRQKLSTDSEFRSSQWDKYLKIKLITERDLAIGTKLFSNKFSSQNIVRVRDGYVRTSENGRTEYFNNSGRIVRISDRNNNFIRFFYNAGRLRTVVDNLGRKMIFTINEHGLVEKILGTKGRGVATFRYNDRSELVYSKDVDGNAYEYGYDEQGRHNLTSIGYTDGTAVEMTYYPLKEGEYIKSVKERDGTLTTYVYLSDKNDPDYFGIEVISKDADGEKISQNKYEYFLKRKRSGEDYTAKMISTLDGDRTETEYHPDLDLPIVIRRGNEETRFRYDNAGHITRKETSTEVSELEYDPKANEVSYVKTYSKSSPDKVKWSKFVYDEKRNLVYAENSEQKSVKLIYDEIGRVIEMIDQNKRRILLKYNENSKPIEITDPAIGTITVTYTDNGEIANVESTGGPNIATQLTSAFEALQDITRPAGVDLSF